MGWLPVIPKEGAFAEVADVETDLDDYVIAHIEAARVHQMVGRLPELERRVVRWRFGLGGDRMGRRQVARRLRVSVGTVRAIEQRALKHLRAEYGLTEAA